MPQPWKFAMPSGEKSGTTTTTTSSNQPLVIQSNDDTTDFTFLWVIAVIVGIIIVIIIIIALVYWGRGGRTNTVTAPQVMYVDECGRPISPGCPPPVEMHTMAAPTCPMPQQVMSQQMPQQVMTTSPVVTQGPVGTTVMSSPRY